MIRRCTAAMALGLASIASPALAQELDSQTDDFIDATHGVEASIDISEMESTAEVKIGGWLAGRDNPETGPRTDWTWSIGAAYPVGGKDNLLDNATLDRLAGGPKLSVSINALMFAARGNQLDSPNFQRLMRRARDACSTNVDEKLRRGEFRQAAEASPVTVGSTVQPPETTAQNLANAARGLCTSSLPSQHFIANNMPSATLEMNRALYSGYWTAGLEASIGTKKFDFVTPGTLAEGDQRLTSYSATLSAAYYPSDAVSAIRFAAEYSNAPEDLDKAVVCRTVVVTPADDCKFALPRALVREDSLVLRGEYRRFFPFRNGKGGIGAALTGSVDTLSGEYGFELPVYLSLPGDSPVLPGIALGYNSDDDHLSVSFYLKTAFKF